MGAIAVPLQLEHGIPGSITALNTAFSASLAIFNILGIAYFSGTEEFSLVLVVI